MKKSSIVLFAIIAVIALIFLTALFLAFSQNSILPYENSIAVIPVKGEIVSDSGNVGTDLSAMEIVDSIDEAEKNPSVKAILLEINSPGGSVVASRQIVEKIRKTEKPVVAWVSDLGASGAYYVASASDYIIADPDSITGSIGVIAMFPNIEGLLDKIGVKVKIIKKGAYKAIGSPFQEISPEEEALIQKLLDGAFERFKADVLEFRAEKLNKARFESIADGRIISGEQARDTGLIDALGTRDDALKKAADIAGIKEYDTTDYSKKELSLIDLLSSMGYSFGTGVKTGFIASNAQGLSAKVQ